MSQEVHGHEILERLVAAGGTMSLELLREVATSAHGLGAKYYTCSASGMSFDQLLQFLTQRNKVSILEGNVTVFIENICRDGEAHAD